MKKLLCIILATLMLMLPACGTAPTPTTPAATTPAPTTPIVTTPQITTPAVTTPVGTEPLTTPMETAPVVTPICTTPAVTTPIATTPQSTMPISTSPIETTPIATTPTTPAMQESDPYYFGGQNLSPLGNSPYSGELLAEWGVYPVFYLGTHNGYAVYEIKTSLRGIGKKFIGGVPFWWGEVQAVACKDGAVYSLSLAYEEGILTYEDLRAIAWYWYGDVFPKDDYIPVYSNGYYSPDEIGITEAEKAEMGVKWFDETRIETRHDGLRYYGRLDGGILVGKPSGLALELDKIESLNYFSFGLFKNGEMSLVITSDLDDETLAAIEEAVLAYENTILQREDLDDPYWYGGQNLPELEDSVYYDADEAASLPKSHGYLGTYNGYSVCFHEDRGLRGTGVKIIGGVAFWIGQYHTFYVVKDGEWCKLDQAVNDGCLTYENLRTIAYYMYGESFPDDEPFDKSIS